MASRLAAIAAGMACMAAWPAMAQSRSIAPEAVADVITAPVDGDIYRYRAVLVDAEDGADLFIFTDAGEGWQQAVYAPAVVWRGAMAGQEPWLETAHNRSLKIYSENASIGRSRWTQVLTVAYRDSVFQVAGYTLTYYDTLDPKMAGECDVNLLTGKGVANGKAFTTRLRAVPLQDWTQDMRPPECEQ